MIAECYDLRLFIFTSYFRHHSYYISIVKLYRATYRIYESKDDARVADAQCFNAMRFLHRRCDIFVTSNTNREEARRSPRRISIHTLVFFVEGSG